MRKYSYFGLFCALALGTSGCANKHIVRAAPPSVSTPPPEVTEPMPAPVPPAPTQPAEVPPPSAPAAAVPPMVPAKRPAPPRPPTPPLEAPAPKPAVPQIAPVLSPSDLEARKKKTNDDLFKAEGNFRRTDGRQFNPAQQDLRDKINGFIVQAHDAIQKEDWVRAENLANKALVLSEELLKSF